MPPLPEFPTLLLNRHGDHVLQVTLNRPTSLNAINTQMGRDLLTLWRTLDESPGEVRCVVLTGAGERAFCAGGDLKERDGMEVAAWQAQHDIFERAFVALVECSIPVVAAVNGVAFGGGCELVLACDFAYAARSTRFALPEAKLGIMPGMGGTQTLARAVGERRAKELVLTGRSFCGEEGLNWGLINAIAEDAASTLSMAMDTAHTIATNAPLSVRQAKRAIHYGLAVDLLTGIPLRDRSVQPACADRG